MCEGDKGIYIAVFQLDAEKEIEIGRLGRFRFLPGFYFYVGSAQRNLGARLARHARREKPLRWHIDYLSLHARMLGAIVMQGTRRAECALARRLAALSPHAIPGFGASDCRCRGHLFHLSEWPL